jgi:uncharacterized Fe-S cluster-containing radical SAM superfamily protein
MTHTIDTDRFSSELRSRGVDLTSREVLVTRFQGTDQEQDLTEPANCGGVGRLRHFRRTTHPGWPSNPLPIEPAARALGLPAVDELRAQVFQNAVCNWRCWYCYVDFPLLSGNRDHAEMHSADELVARQFSEQNPPAVIDLTGGQPDLVPEWVPWMLDALAARGLEDRVYLWSDDNLSNDYFFTHLSKQQRTQLDEAPNYGKVCCFKGFDPTSFAFNTLAEASLFERQFALMDRLLTETNIDLYAYATFTSPTDEQLDIRMTTFVDSLQALNSYLPLRVVPLRITEFTPTRSRMTDAHRRAVAIQEDAIGAWNAQLDSRFSPSERKQSICDVSVRDS